MNWQAEYEAVQADLQALDGIDPATASRIRARTAALATFSALTWRAALETAREEELGAPWFRTSTGWQQMPSVVAEWAGAEFAALLAEQDRQEQEWRHLHDRSRGLRGHLRYMRCMIRGHRDRPSGVITSAGPRACRHCGLGFSGEEARRRFPWKMSLAAGGLAFALSALVAARWPAHPLVVDVGMDVGVGAVAALLGFRAARR